MLTFRRALIAAAFFLTMLYLVNTNTHLDSKQSITHKSGETRGSFQERRTNDENWLRSILTRIDIEFWQDDMCSNQENHTETNNYEDRFIAPHHYK